MALALTGLRIWDGRSEDLGTRKLTIRVEGTRIAAIASEASLLRDAKVVPLDGFVAMPGLIDAHVHLQLDASDIPAEVQAARPTSEVLPGMLDRSRAMLAAGITTARDLGGPAWHELVLRDRIAKGDIPGPRILCAGQPVTSPRGHCWFWGGEAGSHEEIRDVVVRQLDHGCDWIKVMATGGVVTEGTSPTSPQFSVQELAAVVETA
ncbi:MAG: amidohydrolase family protein, partial [bacterium]|nr:amidohydrolase family protein [bacterium]